MKVKRLKEMPQLQQAVVMMVWGDIKNAPLYSSWRKYERGFVYEGKNYRYRCKFKIEDNHLKMIDAHIEHEQEVIDIMH